ncbi:right-handed parallel beta-helix repeat-containing protein [Candidatus Bipolaricaulota bacterium]
MRKRPGSFGRIAVATAIVLSTVSLPACVADEILNPLGATRHVAPDGSDASDGSATSPWRTVQHAANVLRPGETVYVHDGIYHERVSVNVSGSAVGGHVTLAAYPGDRPILDGTGLPIPNENAAMILIDDRSYVIVDGFEIRNDRATRADQFPTGILLVGAPEHVTIRNCIVHHIANNLPASDGNGPFANGIAVYGTRAPEAARDIRIEGNELHHLETGGSETLVVNGNVDGFAIVGNYIHHVNNIAIDCIGYEGTAPLEAFDRARNGLVSANRIEKISGEGNRYYTSDPYGALGIYVDGGRDIVIERNAILRTDFGIEIASEHPGKSARDIVIASNVVAESRTVGLSVGGWIADWGGAENVTIVNNTFYQNDALRGGHGEVAFLRHVDGITFSNNIVYANEQAAFLLQEAPAGGGVRADHNLFFSPRGNADGFWVWEGREFATFAAYRAKSGNDGSSLVADPHFEAPDAGNFLPEPGSPCIDAGDNQAVPESAGSDHAGGPRILDGDGDWDAIVDIGAFESPEI